jgi:hypothetical protein
MRKVALGVTNTPDNYFGRSQFCLLAHDEEESHKGLEIIAEDGVDFIRRLKSREGHLSDGWG